MHFSLPQPLRILHLRQLVDRSGEFKVLREEFGGLRIHQLVRLSDGDIGHTSYIANLLLAAFVLRGLGLAESIEYIHSIILRTPNAV